MDTKFDALPASLLAELDLDRDSPSSSEEDRPAEFDDLPLELQETIIRLCSPIVRLVCREWARIYMAGLTVLYPSGHDTSDQARSITLLHRTVRSTFQLKVLNLSNFRWRRLVPPAYLLTAIASCPLAALSFDGWDRLVDADLAAILRDRCVRSLQSLDLGSCSCLTDASLALVASLLGRQLKNLSLRFCQAVQPLPGGPVDASTPLNLFSSGGGGANKRQPAGMTIEGVRTFVFEKMPNLVRFDLSNWAGLPSDLFEQLGAKLPHLQTLSLAFATTASGPSGGRSSSLNLDHLTHLRSCSSLQSLSLEGCYIVHSGSSNANPFLHLTHLRQLNIARATVSPQVFESISVLTGLRSLNLFMLSETRVLDGNMLAMKLTTLQNLENLDASFCGISDTGIQHIACFPKLRDLRISSGEGLSDYAISTLAQRSASLTRLDLSLNGRLTDRAAVHLATMPALEILDLAGCSCFTWDGLACLARAPMLRVLNLSDLGIGHEEIAGSLGPRTWRLRSGYQGEMSALLSGVEIDADACVIGSVDLPPDAALGFDSGFEIAGAVWEKC